MKKILLPVFLLASFGLRAQIPNAGMELWTADTLSFEPVNWSTFNYWAVLTNAGAFPVTQSNDAVHGNSSIKLSCFESPNGDTAISFASCQGWVDEFGFHGGFPVTAMPDSLVGWIQHDLQPGDTTFLIVAIQDTGTIVTMAVMPVFGTTSGWTYFELDIPPYAGVPDTCLIVLAATNFDNPQPGSWTQYDSLALRGTTDTIPSWSFEDWTVSLAYEPDAWTSSNIYQLQDTIVSVTRSSDTHSGSWSSQIETSWSTMFGDYVGWMLLGELGDEGEMVGVPWTNWVNELTFWYKSAPQGADEPIYVVGLTRWDSVNGVRDSIFYQEGVLSNSATWTQATISISHSGAPDSCFIGFASSNFNGGGTVTQGSKLWVDDMNFNIIASVKNPFVMKPVTVWPVPADQQLNILSEIQLDGTLQLFDAQGRLVKGMKVKGAQAEMETASLPPGNYFLQIRSGHEVQVVKVVVAR